MDDQRYDARQLLLDIFSFGFEDCFTLFEAQTEHDDEIVLYYLLAAMPNATAWWRKANVFAFYQIDVAYWAYIDEILEADITKA